MCKVPCTVNMARGISTLEPSFGLVFRLIPRIWGSWGRFQAHLEPRAGVYRGGSWAQVGLQPLQPHHQLQRSLFVHRQLLIQQQHNLKYSTLETL
jgi:hypothetical protein